MFSRMTQKPQLSTFLINLEKWELPGFSNSLLAIYIPVNYSCDHRFLSTWSLQSTLYFITLISSSLSTKLDFFSYPGCLQELHWVCNWAACLSVARGDKGWNICPLAWLRECSQPCIVFMPFPEKGLCLSLLMPRVSFEQDRYELRSLRAGSSGGGQK